MVSRDCDFIPAEYHEQRQVRGVVRQRVFGIVGMIGIMVVWLGAHYFRVSSAEAMMVEIAEQKAQVESVAARKAEMEQAKTVLSNIRELMQTLAGGRSLVTVFGELSHRVPDSIVLTGCQLYEPSLSDFATEVVGGSAVGLMVGRRGAERDLRRGASAPEVVDVESMRRGLTLYGVARSIPDIIDFAAALDKSPAFFEVDMDVREPTMFAGRPARRFRMTCRIAHEAVKKQ
ncbi:MAG: hypothetical protein H6818_20605 [Phycisphaerales bacterium]|nr:hypothetical protein [Phycisphaerales bacterium]